MGTFPDKQFYRTEFSPWLGYGEFAEYQKLSQRTLLGCEKLYYLYSLFLNTVPVLGDVAECGVYQGGSANMLTNLVANKCPGKRIHLFDTFKGMPVADQNKDTHKVGDFGDTSLEVVKGLICHDDIVSYHVGMMPDSFKGMEGSVFSFIHLDVDQYQSYIDCLTFLWPRLSLGGIMVFDDYGHPNCPGARKAIDEFFTGKRDRLIVLLKGQACIIKVLD